MKTAFFAISLCLLTSPALAMFPRWCLEAYEAGDIQTAERMAKTIMGSPHGYNQADAAMGIECLRRFTGETYTYHVASREFVSPADRQAREEADRQEAEARKANELAEAERQKFLEEVAQRAEIDKANRERTVATRLHEACYNLYSRDPEETITNPLCFDVFWRNGLPE